MHLLSPSLLHLVLPSPSVDYEGRGVAVYDANKWRKCENVNMLLLCGCESFGKLEAFWHHNMCLCAVLHCVCGMIYSVCVMLIIVIV